MRTTLDFGGTPLTVTAESRHWDVEVGGTHHQARYLDVALEAAFPNARRSDRDRLQVQLLEWAAGPPLT
jgi:hypothetical protein